MSCYADDRSRIEVKSVTILKRGQVSRTAVTEAQLQYKMVKWYRPPTVRKLATKQVYGPPTGASFSSW